MVPLLCLQQRVQRFVAEPTVSITVLTHATSHCGRWQTQHRCTGKPLLLAQAHYLPQALIELQTADSVRTVPLSPLAGYVKEGHAPEVADKPLPENTTRLQHVAAASSSLARPLHSPSAPCVLRHTRTRP